MHTRRRRKMVVVHFCFALFKFSEGICYLLIVSLLFNPQKQARVNHHVQAEEVCTLGL
jgi:hypothetical protein